MKFVTIKTDAKGESSLLVGPSAPGAVHRKTVMEARGNVQPGERIACYSLTPVSAATGKAASEPEPEPEAPEGGKKGKK
jgi:hypothetical protein